jgi:hypothetical protein
MILKVLEKMKVVWSLREPPEKLKASLSFLVSREKLERAVHLLKEARSLADPLAREAWKYLKEVVHKIGDHPLSRDLERILKGVAVSSSPYASRVTALLEDLQRVRSAFSPSLP